MADETWKCHICNSITPGHLNRCVNEHSRITGGISPSDHQCAHIYGDGTPCREPGTSSDSLLGGGPWKCAHHNENRPGAAPGYAAARKIQWPEIAVRDFLDLNPWLGRDPYEGKSDYTDQARKRMREELDAVNNNLGTKVQIKI